MLKKIINILYFIVVSFLILAGIAVILSAFDIPFAYKFLTVQSGSMEPKINLGSLVVVKSKDNYKIGDVITFRPADKKGLTITHRVFEIVSTGEGVAQFVTKGDANKDSDSERIPREAVIGKVVFTLPYLGFLISFIRKPIGTILLIIVPALLFIVAEIVDIRNEIILYKKKKKRMSKHGN